MKARKEFGADKLIEGEAKGIDIGEKNKAVEIVKEMLKENYDIKSIIKLTKLSEKKINPLGVRSEIKKDMGF